MILLSSITSIFNNLVVGDASAQQYKYSEFPTEEQAQTTTPLQAQGLSLQENSLTTNVKPKGELPSLNTEPQNTNLDVLLENPHLKALLENPELDALLENQDGKALLEDPDVKALLEDPDVNALLENPDVKAQLEKPTISALTGLFP